MERRKVILDVDTGSDDSIAIIAALLCPEAFEVLGITTVNGNRCVDYTTENTLRIVELMGMEDKVPVFRGCASTYVSIMLGRRPGYPRRDGSGPANNAAVHGDFIDQCPPSHHKEQRQNAVSWLVETLLAAEDDSITLIPIGPLTNIAHAVAIEPRIVPKVHEIMFMGGGWKIGNKSAVGEMNVWLDPEAAQVVLKQHMRRILTRRMRRGSVPSARRWLRWWRRLSSSASPVTPHGRRLRRKMRHRSMTRCVSWPCWIRPC